MYLKWTGHPLADCGVAALLAIAGKNAPEELDTGDLEHAAGLMQRLYFDGPIGNYLSCVFPNSEYVQPGKGDGKKQKRQEYAKEVLWAFEATQQIDGARCTFSGQPATHRLNRVHMPLLTGQDVINFFPAGQGGLYVAGPYVTALQALPLGGRRCEGRLLAVHADDEEVMVRFAKRYWADNQRLINMATGNQLPLGKGPDASLAREAAAEGKFPDAKAPKTLLLDDLQQILMETRYSKLSSVTAYWLSNSGRGPAIDIIQVPGLAVRFLARLGTDPYRTPWLGLLSRGWQTRDEGKAKKKPEGVSLYGPGRTRNSVLNEILAVFEGGFVDMRAASTFVRRHLLWQAAGKTAPESWSAFPSWTLTDCFVHHLLGMTQERLNRIREFADRLAQFIQATNDRQFLREVLYGEKEWHVRNALVKAQRRSTNSSLLFGLDDYVEVFMADDGMGREPWGLIRDLVVIRVVETLHSTGYFGDKTSVLEEPAATEDAA